MRIIKFLLSSILVIAVAAGVIGLVAREVQLSRGESTLKKSLSTLRKLATQKTYYDDCREKGTNIIEGDTWAILQLRFLSSTEYVVEILCNQFSIDPIVVDKQQLPFLVKKVAGQSGVVWGEDRSGVILEVYGRRTALGIKDGQIVEFSLTESLGDGPTTSCVSYGFECCLSPSQLGVGEQLNGVSDCPKSCFSSCVSRPMILSFNTKPLFDQKTRQIEISSGATVSFVYVLELGQALGVEVELDYGDGEVQKLNVSQAATEHLYECSQTICSYPVKLSVVDSAGVSAVDLPINQMVVKVKGVL